LAYEGLKKTIPISKGINTSNMSIGINHPLIGLISLTSNLSQNERYAYKSSVIDMIWSVDGFGILPLHRNISDGVVSLSTILGRPKNSPYNEITKEEWRVFIGSQCPYEFKHGYSQDKEHPERILGAVIGWMTAILYRSKGRYGLDISDLCNKYYLKQASFSVS